jgi:ADP-heptose:LPS heptosyltransferase
VGLDDELQMINVKLGHATKDRHFSERLLPWLEELGVNTAHRHYWVPRSTTASQKVAASWPRGRVVGLCPYGASKSRHLSVGQIQFIAEQVLSNPAFKLLMIVRPDQAQTLQQTLGQQPWFQRVFFQSTPDLFELCEQVAMCEAVVSVDTAIVHVASGLDKPLLAFYAGGGPQTGNFKSWHANNPRAICQFVRFGEPLFNEPESKQLLLGLAHITSL